MVGVKRFKSKLEKTFAVNLEAFYSPSKCVKKIRLTLHKAKYTHVRLIFGLEFCSMFPGPFRKGMLLHTHVPTHAQKHLEL